MAKQSDLVVVVKDQKTASGVRNSSASDSNIRKKYEKYQGLK